MLKVSNLNVYYHKVIQALRGVSFEVPKGKIVSLLGSNGAGKSTALNAISKILKFQNGEITEGKIQFNGVNTHGQSPHNLVKAGMAYVREGRKIFSDLTVNENLVAASFALNKPPKKNDFDQFFLLNKYSQFQNLNVINHLQLFLLQQQIIPFQVYIF